MSDPRVVPTTAATVRQWAEIWVAMCVDGDLVRGPLDLVRGPPNDDEHARRTFGVTGRQQRNIRSAATTGALARRAAELGVKLPAGFPQGGPHRINGLHLDVGVR